MNVVLWVLQVLLALVFLFSGGSKFVMSIEDMTKQIALPGLFLRFIGVCEILGGLGLILPGIFRTKTWLTPLAAAGLAITMIGANIIAFQLGPLAAVLPLITGILCAFVAYGRWRARPLSE
jgi:uncharacterized membrane protein YphA (DoxX/SURF4 family)